MLTARVSIQNSQEALPISTSQIEEMMQRLFEAYDVQCREVFIHFVDKKAIGKIHKDFFGDPSPTDCISFPIDPPESSEEDSVLGEIFVCPEVAVEYSEEHQGDPQEEVSLYLIHGFLHLVGYDDIEAVDRQEMRRQEKKCIALLSTNKP